MVIDLIFSITIVLLVFWIISLREDIKTLKTLKKYDELGIQFRDKWIEEWKREALYYKERCTKLKNKTQC